MDVFARESCSILGLTTYFGLDLGTGALFSTTWVVTGTQTASWAYDACDKTSFGESDEEHGHERQHIQPLAAPVRYAAARGTTPVHRGHPAPHRWGREYPPRHFRRVRR